MVKEINGENFAEEVLQEVLPVFVDFWAEWCGPCKAISPIVEALSEEFKDKVKFVKLNVDQNPEIASKFGIMSIPTMIVFHKGKIIAQTVGSQTKAQLKNFLNGVLNRL